MNQLQKLLSQSVLHIHNISLSCGHWISQHGGGDVCVRGWAWGGQTTDWPSKLPLGHCGHVEMSRCSILTMAGVKSATAPAHCRGFVITGFKCSLSSPPPSFSVRPNMSCSPPRHPIHLSELPACEWLLKWPICLWIPIHQPVSACIDWMGKASFCTLDCGGGDPGQMRRLNTWIKLHW